jgi:hypothetical protein
MGFVAAGVLAEIHGHLFGLESLVEVNLALVQFGLLFGVLMVQLVSR